MLQQWALLGEIFIGNRSSATQKKNMTKVKEKIYIDLEN